VDFDRERAAQNLVSEGQRRPRRRARGTARDQLQTRSRVLCGAAAKRRLYFWLYSFLSGQNSLWVLWYSMEYGKQTPSRLSFA